MVSQYLTYGQQRAAVLPARVDGVVVAVAADGVPQLGQLGVGVPGRGRVDPRVVAVDGAHRVPAGEGQGQHHGPLAAHIYLHSLRRCGRGRGRHEVPEGGVVAELPRPRPRPGRGAGQLQGGGAGAGSAEGARGGVVVRGRGTGRGAGLPPAALCTWDTSHVRLVTRDDP